MAKPKQEVSSKRVAAIAAKVLRNKGVGTSPADALALAGSVLTQAPPVAKRAPAKAATAAKRKRAP